MPMSQFPIRGLRPLYSSKGHANPALRFGSVCNSYLSLLRSSRSSDTVFWRPTLYGRILKLVYIIVEVNTVILGHSVVWNRGL